MDTCASKRDLSRIDKHRKFAASAAGQTRPSACPCHSCSFSSLLVIRFDKDTCMGAVPLDSTGSASKRRSSLEASFMVPAWTQKELYRRLVARWPCPGEPPSVGCTSLYILKLLLTDHHARANDRNCNQKRVNKNY